MKKSTLRNIIFIILFSVALIFFFINFKEIMKVLSFIFAVLTPVFFGLIIAYVLNSPYRLFYCHVFKKMGTKRKFFLKLKKPLSLIISYAIVFGLLTFLVSILIPDLIRSFNELVKNVSDTVRNHRGDIINISDNVVQFVKDNTGYDLTEANTYNNIIKMLTGGSIGQFLGTFVTNFVPSIFNTALDIGKTTYNWILGIIISIYLLAGKDKLLDQARRVISAYTPEKFYKRFFHICTVFNIKCGKFIIGKIIDSMIIGLMCFIGMSIFNFHYPLLISVIIGVFNMIPFFGPIIGAIPSTLILLIASPFEALWFIVFLLVLQQFDGNILGPKILGETVGVSGFWIMVSIIIGGGLFGVMGMLLGVPVFAAIYTLVREGVLARQEAKQRKAELAAQEDGAEAAPTVTSDKVNNNL